MDTRRALHELSPGRTRIDRKAPSLGPGDEEWPRPDPTRKGAEPPRNQRDRTNDLEGDVRNNPPCRPPTTRSRLSRVSWRTSRSPEVLPPSGGSIRTSTGHFTRRY